MEIIPGPRYVTAGCDGSPNSAVALRRAAAEAGRRYARLDGSPLGGETVPFVLSTAPCNVIVCENETVEEDG
jgi:hypothetical protein